jgi:hypothetical protein
MQLLRRVASGILAIAASTAFLTANLQAQSSTTGAFRGRITSGSDQPVAGAQVVARNTTTGLQRGAITDAAGRFTIPLLPPGGPYTISVTSIGYQRAERTGYQISAGDAITVNFNVAIQAVQIGQIEVVGTAPRIDVTEGGVVTRVGTTQVENLPVAGRDFTDFLNLSPLVSPQPGIGTGGQFSIAGARTSGTNVQIDGADANNIYFGENRGSSRSPFAFSLESIKEFQLITNGYDVEYGNYQGGVVNAVTKTGTNLFRGSAFYYRRDEGLTSKDFAGVEPTEYQVNQFGASFSGPIIKDKLHFFVSADLQRKTQPIFAADPRSTAVNPDSLQRVINALQNVYGVPNAAQYFGQFEQDQDNTVLFGRIDWQLNNKHRLTLRQNFSDFIQTNDRLSPTEAITNTGPFKDKVYSTVAELTSIFSGSAFNTFRFQFSYEDRPRPPSDLLGWLPQITITGVANPGSNASIFFGGDGVLFRNRLEENKLEFIETFNYRMGMHGFKVGGVALMGSNLNTFWNAGHGTYVFNTLRDFENRNPNRFTRSLRACPVAYTTNAAGENVICPEYDVPVAEFDYTEFSAFLQDDIQLSDKLLVTAGLRFSGTKFPDEPVAIKMVADTFGYNTSTLPSFTGLSPRLSFSYNLGTDNSDRVLRGGAAILVGRAPTVLAGNAISTERTILSLSCTAAGSVPTLNQGTMAEMISNQGGERNPAACRTGAALAGRPEYTMFDEDFKLPRTLKASLGYEHSLGNSTRISVDGIFSRASNQFTVKDINLGARTCQGGATASVKNRTPDQVNSCFVLAKEQNRPVFIPRTGTGAFAPTSGGSAAERSDAFGRNTIGGISRTYLNQSDGEAQSMTAQLQLDQNVSDKLQLGLGYAWVKAQDNSSFSCCTSNEGFSGEPTHLSPNLIGDVGDDDLLWGTSRFERRHTLTANFIWRAPLGFRVNGIWRSQSGTAYTPVVNGDVNGDGQAFNDRAMIAKDLQWNDPVVDPAKLDTLLARHSCLSEQLGSVAKRNSCRNPWWHSLDMRLSKEFSTFRGQRAELLVDMFNVLNGLNSDWGRYMQVTGFQTDLLTPRRFDAATGNVVYSVNWTSAVPATATAPARNETGFGVTTPVGFDPYQFQMQIGLRYRF